MKGRRGHSGPRCLQEEDAADANEGQAVQDFLGLSGDEMAFIEVKVALSVSRETIPDRGLTESARGSPEAEPAKDGALDRSAGGRPVLQPERARRALLALLPGEALRDERQDEGAETEALARRAAMTEARASMPLGIERPSGTRSHRSRR